MGRKQYYINQYKFNKLQVQGVKLIFKEEDKVSYSISENLLFKKLYEITGKEFKEYIAIKNGESDETIKAKPSDNPLEDIFILKANSIKADDMEAITTYDKIVKDGCYINNVHYVYAEKSSSMIRTQKTVFIKEDVLNTLQKHLTMGKQPEQCVTSKWLTTKGYLLSSVDVLDLMPRIVVIPDFNREIIDDVYIMEDYKPTDEELEEYEKFKQERKEQNKQKEEYKKVLDKAHKLFDKDYFHSCLTCSYIPNPWKEENLKSINKWKELGRKVKPEEILKPQGYSDIKGDNYYSLYAKDQTEEIKILPVNPLTCGKNKVFHENYETEINAFDGEGIMSMDFAEKVRKALNVPYQVNSIQLRLPYIKSNVVRVDWKNWMLSHGIRKIQPMTLGGEPVDPLDIVKDVDIIITESCFKAKLEKAEGKNGWLFENMQEYYNLLAKYGWTYMGITNYSHPHNDKEYNTLTYQYINSTELSYKDLCQLGLEEYQMLRDVMNGDIGIIKYFLNIVINKKIIDVNGEEDEDEEYILKEEDYKDKAKVIMQVIEENQDIIYDKEVQKFLYNRVKNYYEDMLIGRILIQSQFLVATSDVIAFMEWAGYRNEEKVKGFLGKDEFFCNGKNEEYVMTRYPLCHFSEIKSANFINKEEDKNNYKWIKHLDNIIQFNTNDLTMVRLNEDFDGDKNLLIKANTPISGDRTLKDIIVNDYPIYNPGDKATAKASEFNTEAILKFEHLNLNNETGKVTNLNTTYQTLAHWEESLKTKDFESSMCKYLQGEIIDSVKKGNAVKIPSCLKQNAPLKSYFMRHIYGEGENLKYYSPKSPLDYFCLMVEKKIKKLYPVNSKEELEISSEDKKLMYKLMQCSSGDSKKELELLATLIPIFNDYSTKRGKIIEDGRKLNRLSSLEEDKEAQKLLKERYKELYQETRDKAVQACIDVFGELKENILASVAVDIEYVYAKSSNNIGVSRNKAYNFPWIVSPAGIVENVKVNKGKEKTKIYRVNEKDAERLAKEGVEVIKIMEKTLAVKTVNVPVPKTKEEGPVTKNLINISNYQCNLMFCKGQEASDKLQKNENKAVLKLKDNQYYTFYADKDEVASIAKQYINYIAMEEGKESFSLKDYVNKEFEIKVLKVNKASLITEISCCG